MTTITVTIPTIGQDQWISRVDGVVCTNGSRLVPVSRREAEVSFKDAKGFDRTDLTPTEVATFVRNFLDEGFDAPITIS